jgi:hypothetical protein
MPPPAVVKPNQQLPRPVHKLWRWTKNIVGGALALIGLAGLPEDVATWSTWIDTSLNHPRVLDLANRAVQLSEYINQGWLRGLFFVGGITIVLWAWRPFWRVRHKWLFRWRRLLSEQVWISRDDAIKLIKESPWGRLKEPNVVQTVNVFDAFSSALTKQRVVYGMSETEKKLLRFDIFIEKTLTQFCEVNPSACRNSEGRAEIDETALRKFLMRAIDDEIRDEFGALPDYKVS